MNALDGRVAAITGGTRGIGLAMARTFLAEGARVAINGRSPEKGAAALKELDAGDRAIYVAGDVKQRTSCDELIDRAVSEFGSIEVLVNNAGGSLQLGPVTDMSDEDWYDTMRWNLDATFFCTRRALPHMIEAGWGRVINVTSLEGKVGKPGISAYCSAKHAIHGFTKSIAQEVGQAGVTVNAICPGLVRTDIIEEAFPGVAAAMGLPSADAVVELFLQHTATKTPNTVEEMANVAMMLVGPNSAGITGAIISVDGGSAPY